MFALGAQPRHFHPMIGDPETGVLLKPATDGRDKAVIELSHCATAGAEDVVMMAPVFGGAFISVCSIVKVEPGEDACGCEEFKSAIHCYQAYVGP